jgi:hypothetical protein
VAFAYYRYSPCHWKSAEPEVIHSGRPAYLARNHQYPGLLESMATFQNDLISLELIDIELRSSSEVQLLADFLGSRGGALASL